MAGIAQRLHIFAGLCESPFAFRVIPDTLKIDRCRDGEGQSLHALRLVILRAMN